MVAPKLDRRLLLSAGAAFSLAPLLARSQGVVDLTWIDLLPEGQTGLPAALQGLVEHDEAPLFSQQPESSGVRYDWNGQVVRLPGFIVPLDFAGNAVSSFILVPFVGACIHVPPPPANQLVFVTVPEPYEFEGLYDPVSVTGMFGVSSTSTHLAKVGYAMTAERIEPFSF